MQIRSTQEEQIRQLRRINRQLNPGPPLAKFLFWVVVALYAVFGSYGLLMFATGQTGTPGIKVGLFSSPCYPPVGGKRDPRCR
jgi:hypothetical protein